MAQAIQVTLYETTVPIILPVVSIANVQPHATGSAVTTNQPIGGSNTTNVNETPADILSAMNA